MEVMIFCMEMYYNIILIFNNAVPIPLEFDIMAPHPLEDKALGIHRRSHDALSSLY